MVALHLIQDLSSSCAAMDRANSLSADVSAYLEWQQLRADALEDGDTGLAASVGRSMQAMRETHEQYLWRREIEAARP